MENRRARRGRGRVRDVSGLTVTPGLIDIHTHIYHKATFYGVDPDPIAARSVIATLVDAGSAGAGNFEGLREFIFVVRSPFRPPSAYLNISYPGIFALRPRFRGQRAADPRTCRSSAASRSPSQQNRDIIVGVKVRLGSNTSGAIGLESLDRAIAAAERLGLPLMSVHRQAAPTYAETMARLRPEHGPSPAAIRRRSQLAGRCQRRRCCSALIEGAARGVLFDIGHGMGAFGFESAEAALAKGFAPDIISSDVHALSPAWLAGHRSLRTMSELINRRRGADHVDAVSAWRPTRLLARATGGREDLGHLSVRVPSPISA